MKYIVAIVVALLICVTSTRADMAGPSRAYHALSPNGTLLVRIKTQAAKADHAGPPEHIVSYYEYDSAVDGFTLRSTFNMKGYLSQFIYVSDAGDMVMISLCDEESILLYARDGKLLKTWNLKDFLSASEIDACAQTGSTLQWFDEAEFNRRTFAFSGPSRRIRALRPPFTVMRGADEKVRFSALIDVASLNLTKSERP